MSRDKEEYKGIQIEQRFGVNSVYNKYTSHKNSSGDLKETYTKKEKKGDVFRSESGVSKNKGDWDVIITESQGKGSKEKSEKTASYKSISADQLFKEINHPKIAGGAKKKKKSGPGPRPRTRSRSRSR